MTRITHLPDQLRTADPHNVRLVYDPTAQYPPGRGQLTTEMTLRRRQAGARGLGSVAALAETRQEVEGERQSDGEETGPLTVDTWEQLIEQTSGWVDRHIDSMDPQRLAEYAERSGQTLPEAIAHVKKVARDGIATTAAFLEVVAKVVAPEEFEEPDKAIAGYASRSQGFILEWTGVHGSVDPALAAALAEPGSKVIDVDSDNHEVFDDLRFNTELFVAHEGHIIIAPNQTEGLRYTEVKKPRNSKYPVKVRLKHPGEYDKGESVLFGCPARHMVPFIYKKMVEDAAAGESSSLLSRTYYVERERLSQIEQVGDVEPEIALV